MVLSVKFTSNSWVLGLTKKEKKKIIENLNSYIIKNVNICLNLNMYLFLQVMTKFDFLIAA